MADGKITEVRTTQIQRLTPRGEIKEAFRVEFEVDGQGPFAVELDAGEFIPERVREEMEKIAATVRGISS